MGNHPFDSMKGIFNRKENENSPKKNNNKKHLTRRSNKNSNHKRLAQNQNISNNIGVKQNVSDISYQRELSEIEKVYLQHMRHIETEINKLITDVQYLDSKNPVVSSQMKKIMVELITNVWIIGNIVTTYKEENKLTVVTNLLSKYEEKYLKDLEDPNVNPDILNELNEIKLCQNIINESLHPINSILEYYNILMFKLSNWGFEVKNPVGKKYNVHMDMDVLAFEESDSNLEELRIIETKKPEIYLNGNKIAKAQIIVRKAGKKNKKTVKKIKKNINGDEK